MIHSRKAAKTLVLGGLSALLLTSAAFAASIGTDVGAVTGSSVRMRSDASTSSSIVTTLNQGTVVSILDGASSEWYKIAYDGNVGYISSDYLVVDQDGVFTALGKINGNAVNVRASASADSESLASLNSGATVTINGFSEGWYKVTCQYGTVGYIRSDFVDLTTAASAASSSSKGSSVIATAKQYLGTRYVYGGSSPSGFDCSGFTMYVYSKYGYSLPHSATSQWQSGTGTRVYSRSSLQAGDLVFFCDPSRSAGKACSHTGIYIGGGQFIHASSSRGVIVSSLSDSYYSGYFVGGKHIG